jgi:hypothetical protein
MREELAHEIGLGSFPVAGIAPVRAFERNVIMRCRRHDASTARCPFFEQSIEGVERAKAHYFGKACLRDGLPALSIGVVAKCCRRNPREVGWPPACCVRSARWQRDIFINEFINEVHLTDNSGHTVPPIHTMSLATFIAGAQKHSKAIERPTKNQGVAMASIRVRLHYHPIVVFSVFRRGKAVVRRMESRLKYICHIRTYA